MQHSFDVRIAEKYGIQPAIILNHLYFWIEKNRANEKNFYDGHYWTYNSKKALTKLFPYMTARQIDYAMKKLIDEGLVITGNYNKLAYDRTLWYAITKLGYSILQNCEMEETKARETILQNCEMEETELSNGIDEIVKPIPDINTDINTDNNKKERKKENVESQNLSFESQIEKDRTSKFEVQDSKSEEQYQRLQTEITTNNKRENKKRKFVPPTIEEVKEYCGERNNNIDPEAFIAFYTSKGWKVGNQPMKDWKSAVITWEIRHKNDSKPKPKKSCAENQSFTVSDLKYNIFDDEEFENGEISYTSPIGSTRTDNEFGQNLRRNHQCRKKTN